MPTTLTQRARRTPGARNFWARAEQAARDAEVAKSLVVPWTIIGTRIDADDTERTLTATSFGRTADEAIERFLVTQDRQRANVFGELPPRFERHELRAEREGV